MENGAFSQEEFAEWSKDHVIYLHVSTMIEGKEHEGLFKEKGFTGFPTFAILDESGTILAKHAGERNPAGFGKTVEKAKAYRMLRKQADAGDTTAKMHVFVKDLELGTYDYARGSLRYAALAADMPKKLRDEARAQLATLLYNELNSKMVAKIRGGMDRKLYMAEREELMMEFFLSGNLPAGYAAGSVLSTVLSRAQRMKDVKLFEQALAAYKARFEGDRYYGRNVERFEQQLEELRGDGK